MWIYWSYDGQVWWASADLVWLTAIFIISVPQILDGELTDKYHTVQDLVGTKAKKVHDAKKKAERLRDEAKELLKDAQNKLQRLAGEWRG